VVTPDDHHRHPAICGDITRTPMTLPPACPMRRTTGTPDVIHDAHRGCAQVDL
jgi:hypothetical protein